MDLLNRSLAPISVKAWKFMDEEAREILKLKLNGRKVVDFIGPRGINYAAVNSGRKTELDKGISGVNYQLRSVLPLVEMRVPFRINKKELEALERGAVDIDLDPLVDAAKKLAEAENNLIFYGHSEAGIRGIAEASKQPELKVPDTSKELLVTITGAVKTLYNKGVGGPYLLLLSPELYSKIYKMSENGYPVNRKIKEIIGDNIKFVCGIDFKGMLMSTRGGDFELIVGQDISIGYERNTVDDLEFFFIESLTFRLNTPEAAVVFT